MDQMMCVVAFGFGLALIVFSAVVYVTRGRRTDGKLTFKVFGQEFNGGMLGAFLVVGLILSLSSLAFARHQESSTQELVKEADQLVSTAAANGASEHAPTTWKETTEAKQALDKELALQNSRLPFLRSYERTKELAASTKSTAGGSLERILKAKAIAIHPQTPSPWTFERIGDCNYQDASATDGPMPQADRCTPETPTAICWDGEVLKNGGARRWCTYKTVAATNCSGGNTPGRIYSCAPQR